MKSTGFYVQYIVFFSSTTRTYISRCSSPNFYSVQHLQDAIPSRILFIIRWSWTNTDHKYMHAVQDRRQLSIMRWEMCMMQHASCDVAVDSMKSPGCTQLLCQTVSRTPSIFSPTSYRTVASLRRKIEADRRKYNFPCDDRRKFKFPCGRNRLEDVFPNPIGK